MRHRIVNILRNLAPSPAISIYRRLSGKGGFYGDYSTWEDARKLCTGYDVDIILEKVMEAALKVRKGDAAYEQDSVQFDRIRYSWPLLAGLLWIASRNGNRLSLLDFGGSLGTTYLQNVRFLNHLDELRWGIVEQEKFVQVGKRYFENEHLTFYYNPDECIGERRPDTILFSGVLQYLEKPYEVLVETLRKGFRQVILDRTPFLERGEDRITVQIVPPEIYPASYPAWFFNLEKFRNFFSGDFDLIAEFDSLESFNLGEIHDSQGKGFIFRRKELGR